LTRPDAIKIPTNRFRGLGAAWPELAILPIPDARLPHGSGNLGPLDSDTDTPDLPDPPKPVSPFSHKAVLPMTTESERTDETKPTEDLASTDDTTAATPAAGKPETEDEGTSEPAAEATETETPSEVPTEPVASKDETPEVEAEKPAAEEAEKPAEEPAADAVVMETSTESTEEKAASAEATPTVEAEDATDEAAAKEQADAVAADKRLESKYKAGQRLEVKLVQVGEKDSFVDFGGPAEGTIATAELKNSDGEMRVNEGDTFTAIIRKAGDTVEFTVGRGKGGDLLRMRELQSAFEGEIPVTGKIKSTNKGGFEVDLNGVRAFCPFSQIDTVYCDTPEDHVGNEYTFQIIAFERGGRNIVLSRRKIMEVEGKEAAKKTRETLAVGMEFEGAVRRLQPYGAFVDLGGVDGLVHVSEISRGHVADPRDVLKVGQTVRVQVIALENLGAERERISLSMKILENDPWDGADTKWAAGSIVNGKVVRLTDFGAFIELSPGVDGLVHVSEISTERIEHPSSVLEPGQTVEVRILSVDPDSRRISLTMRPEGEDRPQRAPRQDYRDDGGPRGGGRGRRQDNRPLESYTFGDEEPAKEENVDVSDLDYTDAVELLKRKFNRQ